MHSLEKGKVFWFQSLFRVYLPYSIYIIRLLGRVYHFSLLICYPCSIILMYISIHIIVQNVSEQLKEWILSCEEPTFLEPNLSISLTKNIIAKIYFWFTYWSPSLCKIWGKLCCRSRVMKAGHYQRQIGPLGPNKSNIWKTSTIIYMYLSAPFNEKTLKKILCVDLSH